MTKDGPLGLVLLCVSSGAAFGASLRWALSYALNSRWIALPLRTLSANLIGGFFVGLVTAWLLDAPQTPSYYRLFLVTGLLGGLTTFSTFSMESVTMLMNGLWGRALLHTLLHLGGSLSVTALAFMLYRTFIQ